MCAQIYFYNFATRIRKPTFPHFEPKEFPKSCFPPRQLEPSAKAGRHPSPYAHPSPHAHSYVDDALFPLRTSAMPDRVHQRTCHPPL